MALGLRSFEDCRECCGVVTSAPCFTSIEEVIGSLAEPFAAVMAIPGRNLVAWLEHSAKRDPGSVVGC